MGGKDVEDWAGPVEFGIWMVADDDFVETFFWVDEVERGAYFGVEFDIIPVGARGHH